MRIHPVVRDVVLLGIALSVGWWMRGAGTTVLAERSDGGLAFQLSGIGPDTSLTVYNPDRRVLYVYPRINGNSHISCGFSLSIPNPGAPIDRQNCPVGSLVP